MSEFNIGDYVEFPRGNGWAGGYISGLQADKLSRVWARIDTGDGETDQLTTGIRHFKGFTTKDSGARAEFDSGMQRDTNKGKPRFDLLAPDGVPYRDQILTRFAALMARGAEKYSDRNWEKAAGPEELARFRESAFRHFFQWLCGETDEDHAAAIFFNVMGAEYAKGKQSTE